MLLDVYQQAVSQGTIKNDAEQQYVVKQMDQLLHQLTHPPTRAWLPWTKIKPLKGLYLWGQVGVGKTFLMDLFYQHLDIKSKKRVHFHAFMHDLRRALFERQGETNPLQHWANALADEVKVLCLDEFIVDEVANAMLLADLLKVLFDRGVVLITSSNTAPKNLYQGGLQRERFLPAIDLIEQYNQVIHLQIETDYRLEAVQHMGCYLTPINDKTTKMIHDRFRSITSSPPSPTTITLQQRQVSVRALEGKVIWFEFKVLCASFRSQDDYLELSQRFDTILLENVPIMQKQEEIRRFVLLIDILYDNDLTLVIQAAAPPEKLFNNPQFTTETQRTISRLHEMTGVGKNKN